MYTGKTRAPITVILLSIVTCGIYLYFWYYTIMNDLNKASNKEVINPALFLVLSIFCAPVLYYVMFTVDKNLEILGQAEGTGYKSNFILWLVLTLVAGLGTLVAMFQITNAFNELWAKRSAS